MRSATAMLATVLVCLCFLHSSVAQAGEAGCVLHLGFDALKEGKFEDLSGNGNDGIPHNTPPCPGVNGYGLYIGGSGQCVSVPVPDGLKAPRAFTLEAWIAPDQDKIDGLITTGNFDAGEEAFGLYTVYGKIDLTYTRADGTPVRLRTEKPHLNLFTLPERTWTHVAGTFDGSQAKIYVNGKLVEEGEKEPGQKLIPLKNPILIGKLYGNPWWALIGAMDEVRIHDRALSAEQILAHYKLRDGFKPARLPERVPGTIDGLPYRDARTRLGFGMPAWIYQLGVKGAGWLNFSNTGDFFFMLTGGTGMRYDLFRFGLLDQRQRRERFWTEVDGHARRARVGDGRDCETTVQVKGKTYHNLAVAELVRVTPDGQVTVRYEVSPLDRKAPVPYVPLRFNLPSATAIRFVGRDPSGPVTGNMPDLDRVVRFREGVEWSFQDLRLRMQFGEGVEYELEGKRDAWRWLGGYSGFYGKVHNYRFGPWQEGDGKCVIDFSFKCRSSSDPPLLDRKSARTVTEDKPFDFSSLYRPESDRIRLEPVDRDVPVFGLEEEVCFQAFFPKSMRMSSVSYSVTDAYSGQVILSQTNHTSRDWWFEHPQILFRAPRAGVYLLNLKALSASGEVLGEATQEVAVAGPIPQPVAAPGQKLDLKLVDTVDCTRDDTHDFFSYSGQSKVVRRNGVAYRETLTYEESISSGLHCDWFGYRFRLKNPQKVHLIEVEYPDLDAMNMGVNVLEPKDDSPAGQGTAVARVFSGVWSGGDFPADGQLKKFSTIYFPSSDWCAVTCQNLHLARMKNAQPAAASRINVYELQGELPKLGLDAHTDRLLGVFTEDGTLGMGSFGDSPLRGEYPSRHQTGRENFYREYYKAVQNLIRYMRYRGDSVYVYGTYRYRSAYFPSRLFPPSGPAVSGDLIALMARMFKYNGLKLVLAIEANPLMSVIRRPEYANTLDEVRHGAPTLMQISPDGEFIQGAWSNYAPNPFHPIVRDEYARLAAELAERYGTYPAVAGVAWLAGFDDITTPGLIYPRRWTNQDVPARLATTFDDETMRQFEQFLGKKLPGEQGSPKRFRQRFDWTIGNAKAQWIQFRCAKIAQMYKAFKDAMCGKAPQMDFFVIADWVRIFNEPDLSSGLEALRLLSFDPALYVREPNMAFTLVMPPNAMIYLDRGYIRDRALLGNVQKWLNDEKLFSACESAKGGRFLHRQFFENGLLLPPDRRWVFNSSQEAGASTRLAVISYPQPGGRANLWDFAAIMARGTPSLISWMWCDGGIPMGHEQMMREFAYAYRQLPPGRYELLERQGNVFVRGRADAPAGQAAFYAVNTGPEDAEIALDGLPAGITFQDVSSKDIVATSGKLAVALKPYELRVFVEASRQ